MLSKSSGAGCSSATIDVSALFHHTRRHETYRQARAIARCGAAQPGTAGSTVKGELASVPAGERRLSLPAMWVYWNREPLSQQPIAKPHVLKDG
jgi:hypothetical protein